MARVRQRLPRVGSGPPKYCLGQVGLGKTPSGWVLTRPIPRAGITCHLIESKDGAQSGNTIILSLISQQRGFLGNFLELLSEIRTFNPVFEKSHN